MSIVSVGAKLQIVIGRHGNSPRIQTLTQKPEFIQAVEGFMERIAPGKETMLNPYDIEGNRILDFLGRMADNPKQEGFIEILGTTNMDGDLGPVTLAEFMEDRHYCSGTHPIRFDFFKVADHVRLGVFEERGHTDPTGTFVWKNNF